MDTPSSKVLPALSYDVTDDPEWVQFIGRAIVGVESYWTWVADSMAANTIRTYYPQDLRFTFDNDRSLYFSAAQFLGESGDLYGMSDNVLVVFNDEVVAQHQLGSWAVA